MKNEMNIKIDVVGTFFAQKQSPLKDNMILINLMYLKPQNQTPGNVSNVAAISRCDNPFHVVSDDINWRPQWDGVIVPYALSVMTSTGGHSEMVW